jgi:hypothetical protein
MKSELYMIRKESASAEFEILTRHFPAEIEGNPKILKEQKNLTAAKIRTPIVKPLATTTVLSRLLERTGCKCIM